jgi:hypothetical protein
MAIRIDATEISVVVYCTSCGHWASFAWTQAEAELTAIQHEELVHPESTNARDRSATRQRVQRHRGM